MRQNKHQGRRGSRRRVARARAASHPVTLAVGLVIVVLLAAAVAYAVRALYIDYTWHTAARAASQSVASAIQSSSSIEDEVPAATDAVAARPGPGQVGFDQLPYRAEIPADVARIRLTGGGALSVLTRSGALCSGVTFSMSTAGRMPSGSFTCGPVALPPAPIGLRTTPHDASVTLAWQRADVPVEDYAVTYSPDEGTTWFVANDGVSAEPQTVVHSLSNGHPYLFRVAAVNLAGQSPTATAGASPFTRPAPPTNVRATGGFTTVVSWTPSGQDGGRPVTGYIVQGYPTGSCTAAPPETSCEVTDLPAAAAYTFTVRAVNDAGPGAPSSTQSQPVAVFSAPGRPVALAAVAADGAVLLTWTAPLRDGNTPIVDYHVEYRTSGSPAWTVAERAPSTTTAAAVGGLSNGTEYDFRVMAVNAAGVSDPPPDTVSQTPATVPDAAESLLAEDSDESVLLSWLAPAFDGGAPLTDYAVQYAAAGSHWASFDHPAGTGIPLAVTGLDNGTRYSFRVAAINAMGQGPWSQRITGRPFTKPGPVVDPVPVGSLTAIALSWQPPADDGGRPLLGYRVEYRLTSRARWLAVDRDPTRLTALTVAGLVTGESYDFRIVAVNIAGAGPASADGTDAPTLPAVIVGETPPAPSGLRAVSGDGSVTLAWHAPPVGPGSTITAYTVKGTPSGACTTEHLTCVVTGLTNGQAYSFTVTAANALIIGPESERVTATPLPYNEVAGGVITTYSQGGRTFRVHAFTADSTLVVTSASRAFEVLVVAGGGGSQIAADGRVLVGGGGGVLVVKPARLAPGQWPVVVGIGGGPGGAGTVSSLAGVGAAAAGWAGAPDPASPTSATRSAITGTLTAYGGVGTNTSGPGPDGRGTGAGGPVANRGGNGIVIIRYEIAP